MVEGAPGRIRTCDGPAYEDGALSTELRGHLNLLVGPKVS